MKTRWLPPILLSIVFAGCGSNSQSSSDRHHEKDGGFSLVPPSGWRTVEMPGMKYKFFAGTPVDDFAPNINVVDESFAGSLDYCVKQNLTSMEKLFLHFRIVSQEDFYLDTGDRAVKLVANHVQNTTALVQVFYFVNGDGTKFVITCTKLAADDRDLAGDFDASARTFRIEQ